jgi:hypothetical protein
MMRWGLGLLVLSLLHTPLPEPDYHNIRHHDAPGEICEHHDHLLRWHPGAGTAQDVAILHWHWFLPTSQPAGRAFPDSGPAFHAHVSDWAASTWEQAPSLSPDTSSRFTPRPVFSPAGFMVAAIALTSSDHRPITGRSVAQSFGATFAPSASLSTLLQRWIC